MSKKYTVVLKKFDVFLTTVFFCDVSSIKSQYILLFRTILASEYKQDDNVLPMFFELASNIFCFSL